MSERGLPPISKVSIPAGNHKLQKSARFDNADEISLIGNPMSAVRVASRRVPFTPSSSTSRITNPVVEVTRKRKHPTAGKEFFGNQLGTPPKRESSKSSNGTPRGRVKLSSQQLKK